MPDRRLAKCRESLPADYQFGDAIRPLFLREPDACVTRLDELFGGPRPIGYDWYLDEGLRLLRVPVDPRWEMHDHAMGQSCNDRCALKPYYPPIHAESCDHDIAFDVSRRAWACTKCRHVLATKELLLYGADPHANDMQKAAGDA